MISEDEGDKLQLELEEEQLLLLKGKKAQSTYALDYLTAMTKGFGSAETITLNIGSDMPLMLSFDVASGNCAIKYLQAPRISDQ